MTDQFKEKETAETKAAVALEEETLSGVSGGADSKNAKLYCPRCGKRGTLHIEYEDLVYTVKPRWICKRCGMLHPDAKPYNKPVREEDRRRDQPYIWRPY